MRGSIHAVNRVAYWESDPAARMAGTEQQP